MSAFALRRRGVFAGWRGLGRFWLGVAAVLFVVGVTLQGLGPPAPAMRRPVISSAGGTIPRPVVLTPGRVAPYPANRPGRGSPGPIAAPDPGLLESVPGGTVAAGTSGTAAAGQAAAGQAALAGSAGAGLPRIATDGRMPMQVYAAGFDRTSQRPRVGLLLAGIDLNNADSTAAIRDLPGGVTLAFSPLYSDPPDRMLELARQHEHEYLLSLPMEPLGFPNNDPGPHALMTNLPPEQNLQRLDWLLSRISGYAGVTSALGALRGERFAAMADALAPVLAAVGARGLYWVDSRAGQGALPAVWSRSIDLVIDEPADAADIDAKLAALDRLAQDRGSALGLATAPRPVTVARIAAWTNGLMAHGLALAPVSALLHAPAPKDATR